MVDGGKQSNNQSGFLKPDKSLNFKQGIAKVKVETTDVLSLSKSEILAVTRFWHLKVFFHYASTAISSKIQNPKSR